MTMERRVSARDVAQRAGVSRTTVSFVLNNTAGTVISEDTRARVLRAAQELGYIPNEQARNLSMARHHAVGVFICHPRSPFSDSFVQPLMAGVSRVLNKHRYRLVLQQVAMRGVGYRALIQEDDVDGVILVNPHHDDPALDKLLDGLFPTVVVGNARAGRVNQVDVDNRAAAREATEHLIALGHRRIAFISHAPLEFDAAAERRRGYLDAAEPHRDAAGATLERVGAFSEESGYRAAQELLSQRPRPTAILAGNDMIAYGAIQAVRECGLRIPDDVSLVGLDDDYLSRYTNPPLTTIAIPAASLGAEAARLVVAAIASPRTQEPRRLILSHHLTVRGTTAPPRR